jgi:hypothetical protein
MDGPARIHAFGYLVVRLAQTAIMAWADSEQASGLK